MSDEGGFWERVLLRLERPDLAAAAKQLASLSTRRSKRRAVVRRLGKSRGVNDPLTRTMADELAQIESDLAAAQRLLLGQPKPTSD